MTKTQPPARKKAPAKTPAASSPKKSARAVTKSVVSEKLQGAKSQAAKPQAEKLQGEKLQKVLADQGLGSRRTMEAWISAGRVQVNGALAHVGQRVTGADRVQVDNARAIKVQVDHTRVLLLNKAEGLVCTRRDPEGRPTVFAGLPRLKQGRWISVGRLDVQTTGLLLLTNNGALANKMMHPSSGLDREYAVRVNGKLSEAALAQLKSGVMIDGELHRFSDIRYFDGRGLNHWYHVVLLEGKNREVRRLFESLDLMVSRLKRVRYGPILLPSWLPAGQRAELIDADVTALLRLMRIATAGSSGRHRRQAPDKLGKDRSVLIDYPQLPIHH